MRICNEINVDVWYCKCEGVGRKVWKVEGAVTEGGVGAVVVR